MLINKLHIENFKSIENSDIEFDKFTLIIGANAAGKSNYINVFKFISDILNRGLDNAISLQGGIEYLTNTSLPKGTPVVIQFLLDMTDEHWNKVVRPLNIALRISQLNYKFILKPNKRGSGYKIFSDEMSIKYACFSYNSKTKKYDTLDTSYTISFSRKNKEKKITYDSKTDNCNFLADQLPQIEASIGAILFSDIMREEPDELMLYRASFLLPPIFFENAFIRLFDFDPNRLKKSCSMTSIRTLEEDGANIAAVLQNILKDKTNKHEFTKLLSNALPFIESLSIENTFDQSFSYKIKEKYSSKAFYANFLSDGTVSIVAIIIALYFENQSNILILEEPERNIHPALLQKVIEMAKEVSTAKQIILTTHNPEIIKNVSSSNLRFVKRDPNGFSKVSNPSNNETVKCFLENELGLDELFLQGLLG